MYGTRRGSPNHDSLKEDERYTQLNSGRMARAPGTEPPTHNSSTKDELDQLKADISIASFINNYTCSKDHAV